MVILISRNLPIRGTIIRVRIRRERARKRRIWGIGFVHQQKTQLHAGPVHEEKAQSVLTHDALRSLAVRERALQDGALLC